MTGYDYNMARRRRQQRQQPPPRRRNTFSRTAVVNVLIGLAVGIGLGLVYTWVLVPAPYANLTPDTLRQDFESDYILGVAQAYSTDNNLPAARERLAALRLSDAGAAVLARTEALVALGTRESDLRAMSRLSLALGATSPTIQPYLP